MLLDHNDSQLVLIDYQERLMPVLHDAQAAIANARRLLQAAALMQVPSCLTEQNPDKLGPTVADLRLGDIPVMAKMDFSAAAGLAGRLRPPARQAAGNARSLPKHLQKPAVAEPVRNTLVLAGCEAHICLMQTALALLEDEFEVWVVTDACTSRTERNRDAAFDRLAGAGVELVTTEMVAFEWLRSAAHPRFREVSALIK